MKLAFFDILQVGGGLSRFSLLLAQNLVKVDNQLHIKYYIHYNNLKFIPEVKEISNLTVITIASSFPKPKWKLFLNKLLSKIGIGGKSYDAVQDAEAILLNCGCDIAYFPSAHMIGMPKSSIPLVGTVHDFNWKYFFGRQIFSLDFTKKMDKEVVKWMEKAVTICSSNDVVNEAKKLYPNAKKYPTVIPIGPAVVNQHLTSERANQLLENKGINFPFIIFPGNFFPHKNHLNLITAFYLLKQRKGFEDYKLLLTGMNSEQVPRGLATYRGVQLVTNDSDHYDVMGMGYQSNEMIDALIMKATLLVSPSIYEAICTPGMDAWNFGTPTAIADIPPFREHETTWGIRSAFFDPMSPENMADVIEAYLQNDEQRKSDGVISKKYMNAYSWETVANGYLKVFKKTLKN